MNVAWIILLTLPSLQSQPSGRDPDFRKISKQEQLGNAGLAVRLKKLKAQPANVFLSRSLQISPGKSVKYRLFQPADYSPQNRYPLVLFLHGGASRGRDNKNNLTGGSVPGTRLLTLPEIQEKHPSFVLVPQCPRNERWGNGETEKGLVHTGDTPAPAMKNVIRILGALQKEFSIDPGRIYVTGLSMGGWGTWDLIARFPDRFAAAIPICGRMDYETAKSLSKLPIWIFHGDADPKIPVDFSRKMYAALKKAGNNRVRFWEYEGVGHSSWNHAYTEPLLLDWLFSQNRASR